MIKKIMFLILVLAFLPACGDARSPYEKELEASNRHLKLLVEIEGCRVYSFTGESWGARYIVVSSDTNKFCSEVRS